MFKKEKIVEIIRATLAADAYSLGAHWVYDVQKLQELQLDWTNLNDPVALWHKGKKAGDLTHIGDQAYWLWEYLQGRESFDAQEYLAFWQEKMSTYGGYIDGATRETLANLKNGELKGSHSSDFSIIGRIAALLLCSSDEASFVANVQKFVPLTHDSDTVIQGAVFFAKLLFAVAQGERIEPAMERLASSAYIKQAVQKGIDSKERDTFDTIRDFGPACGIDQGFSGIVHLLCKYPNDFAELLVQNAKAGGDSASRGMVCALILSASGETNLPVSWTQINHLK